MRKIALVTGAGRGIGAATACALAADGYEVAVNYRRNRAAAHRVTQQITNQGGNAIAIAADVSLESDVVRLFAEVDRQLGRVTALVNNAGILLPQRRVEATDAERLNTLFATNVTGSFICAREAIKRMSLRHGGEGGAIVNVSSVAARLGGPNEYVDYAATKGALDTLTIGLSVEVANEGIRVNAVRPGFIDTDMHGDGGEPQRLRRVARLIPMLRAGEPAEVATAVAYLLSDQASYITGTFIDVSGGR